jgi:hypothetical protein
VTVTGRDRVLQAIRHEQRDRVPWHFTFTAPAREKAESHYGAGNLDEVLGNHLAVYRPQAPGAWQEVRPAAGNSRRNLPADGARRPGRRLHPRPFSRHAGGIPLENIVACIETVRSGGAQ